MAKKFKYTFKSGSEVNATLPELEKIAKSLGEKLDYKALGVTPRGYYASESRGFTKISDMNEYHIRRALLKTAKEYFAALGNDLTTPVGTFLIQFTNLAEDPTVQDLYTELSRRVK